MLERKSNRLCDFDYAQRGAYFITTVVKGRQNSFGDIEKGTIRLTAYGKILVDQWYWLHKQYPNTALDEFVVMPNHFHGIIKIVETGRDLSLQPTRPIQPNPKPLSELVGAFKTTTSKQIHQLGMLSFHWQRSFYDRIIRNEDELNRIREYIRTNPVRWELDIENNSRIAARDGHRVSQRDNVQDYYDGILQR